MDLSERQYSGARLVRPIERNYGALVEFCLAILKGAEKCGTACFWYQRFTPEEHNARSSFLRVRQNLRKIQVVCQQYKAIVAGVIADLAILGGDGADR